MLASAGGQNFRANAGIIEHELVAQKEKQYISTGMLAGKLSKLSSGLHFSEENYYFLIKTQVCNH